MPFNLNNVVPWGRLSSEYSSMLALSALKPPFKILDCGGGPSSFNAEMTKSGYDVISCDPLYKAAGKDIQTRIEETYDTVIAQARENKADYVWSSIKDPEDLGRVRMSAMRLFLEDFDEGKKAGRYVDASLPHLPFSDGKFDLALSSHFLFLYSGLLSMEFHRASLKEMLRLAREVRIFPLLNLKNEKSDFLPRIIDEFRGQYRCEIVKVEYEFQKGADEMLVVTR